MGFDIDSLLKRKGINKSELAALMGKGDNRSYVTNLLKNPTLKSLQKIADVLKVDIADFFQSDSSKIHLIINDELSVFDSIDELLEYVEQIKLKELQS